MRYTVREIAQAIGAEAVGQIELTVRGVSEPASASPDDLALASTPEYAQSLGKGHALAALLWHGADWQVMGLKAAILPRTPRFVLADLTRMMDTGQGFAPGVHPSAVIATGAHIGADVSIGAGAVVSGGARIGDRCVIGPQCFVGQGSRLGADSLLREQVSIGARAEIGARFIAHPGVRIGGDGFSFVSRDPGEVDSAATGPASRGISGTQSWVRIHSLGGVEIGDDVEIGANSTVDNGTIRPTRIGHGTKIDNLVHVGHNAIIGSHVLICGQVGLAGSVTVGNHVVIAGQVGVSDHVTIGDRVVLGAASKVLRSVPADKVMLGYPATEMHTQISCYKSMRRLPRLLREVERIKKAVFKSPDRD